MIILEKEKNNWSHWVSIPVLLSCEASALPFELIFRVEKMGVICNTNSRFTLHAHVSDQFKLFNTSCDIF